MAMSLTVISLDRTPERWRSFVVNNSGLPFERFAAVDGYQIDRQDLVRDGTITVDNTYAPGALGIAVSHVTLWRRCVATGTPCHVAEDDAVLHPDFLGQVPALLASLETWDMVYWGWNFDWPMHVHLGPAARNVVMQFDQTDMRRRVGEFRTNKAQWRLVPLLSCAGIGAYSISPRGAARLLDRCLPIGDKPAGLGPTRGPLWANTGLDVELSRHHAGCASFACLPPLALLPNDSATSTVQLPARRP